MPKILQRGPAAFNLRTILRKRDNSRATSNKLCVKQQIHNIYNWKRKMNECVI